MSASPMSWRLAGHAVRNFSFIMQVSVLATGYLVSLFDMPKFISLKNKNRFFALIFSRHMLEILQTKLCFKEKLSSVALVRKIAIATERRATAACRRT
jgi:hypothetical protein